MRDHMGKGKYEVDYVDQYLFKTSIEEQECRSTLYLKQWNQAVSIAQHWKTKHKFPKQAQITKFFQSKENT